VSHIPGVLPAADAVGLGHSLLDRYVVFVASRARANTVLATVSDLRVFFSVVVKDPRLVTASDVLDFIAAQRRPRADAVVRLADGEAGLSAQTIKRRLSSVSGLFSWLLIVGEVSGNPVPRGLSTRRANPRTAKARASFVDTGPLGCPQALRGPVLLGLCSAAAGLGVVV
jgi:integrase/recombinase XerD